MHIDVKVSIWVRYHVDDTDVESVINMAKANEYYDCENETLYETEEALQPEDNDNQATVEVYNGDSIVWTNEPLYLIRDSKINEIVE